MSKELFEWQKECLNLWLANDCRGIVNVVTGAGKTVLAIRAISALQSMKETQALEKPLKVKIIVPKTFLLAQWHQALKEELAVPPEEIGLYYGGQKDDSNRKYMIYVVNSARYVMARHVISDFRSGCPVLIIADECHHYGSSENAKIFDFLPFMNENISYFSLGLSATPQCENYDTQLVPALGNEIYRYGFCEAQDSKVISKFSVINISVDFTETEQEEYEDLSIQLATTMGRLKSLCPELNKTKTQGVFFARLENLAKKGKTLEIADLAKNAMTLSYMRKEVLHLASERIRCVCSLIEKLPSTTRIIVFGERIETAEYLYAFLKKKHAKEVGRYHSHLTDDLRKLTLHKYATGEIRILISCRALDEGLNVPSTDVGIILSSTGSERQRIQRLGRILRQQKGQEKTAYLYYLYMGQSHEESTLLPEKKDFSHRTVWDIEKDIAIDSLNCKDRTLYFHRDSDYFYNAQYVSKCLELRRNVADKFLTADLQEQLDVNLNIGMLYEDWMRSEVDCMQRLRSAASPKHRNYWITMLLLSRTQNTGEGTDK